MTTTVLIYRRLSLFVFRPVHILLALMSTQAFAAPDAAKLADRGQALMPIVVGTNASPQVLASATDLAATLRRISGATFTVTTNTGLAGIVVGVPSDFQALPIKTAFKHGPRDREDYTLRSTRKGVWLLGATDLAVSHAVWDLLYRLGYRQFFPGDTWEVVPSIPKLSIAVKADERPDFYARGIWYNWGFWGYNNVPYSQWCARNRHANGFQLNSGHAYEAIIRENQKEFEAHPEYFALVNGARSPGNTKLCISNPGLRQLVVDYAIRQFTANPNMDSISMEPSDGGGWCECGPCVAMGSPSDRALTLANAVAKAINNMGIGDRYVGMYAYNEHCAPPSIKVHPNVIISATTAFIRGGFSLDQIITGWQAKGATLGIYDYYSVVAWDWNMPGAASASRPAGVASTIAEFYRKGARFYCCESGDTWGPYGLGFYVGARTMWDTNEASHVDALVEDFLDKAFGPAKAPMSKFYNLINFDNTRRSASDQIGRMYRDLAAARTLAVGHADILRRIDDLILYTRYVELFRKQASSGTEEDRNAMISYVYRIRKTMMIHAYGIWARTVGQGAAGDPNYPLKKDAPVTEAELLAMLDAGIAANQPVEMGFTAVNFSQDYVPTTPLKLEEKPLGSFPPVSQSSHEYYIWVDKAPMDIHMQVTVQHVWNTRPHKITLYSPLEVNVKAVDESGIVKPDGKTYDVVLHTPYEGLHRVTIVDGGDYTHVVWPKGMPVMLPSAVDSPSIGGYFGGAWTFYCYVPKGTKVIGGWAARIANWAPRISGFLRDGDDHVMLDFSTLEDGWFSVPVPKGQDGRLWKFENNQGIRQLMTIPPCLARNGHELLLPREVVERDAANPRNP